MQRVSKPARCLRAYANSTSPTTNSIKFTYLASRMMQVILFCVIWATASQFVSFMYTLFVDAEWPGYLETYIFYKQF